MTKTLYILDPNLKNMMGHYFEYNRSVADAAVRAGLDCVMLAHRDVALPPDVPCVVWPAYSGDIWHTVPGENYHSEENIAAASAAFASETLTTFERRPPRHGDIIFIPTITHAQLPGAADLMEELGPRGVSMHIMLRYQRAFYESPAATRAFARLAKASETSVVTLCTDSHRLASALQPLTTLPIQVFPIPHTHLTSRSTSPTQDSKAHFVSLGNARGEKGMAEIIEAIRMSASLPWAEGARFTLQINDPSEDVAEVVAELRNCPDPRVTLIDQILDSDAYYALLQKADVALVPYHRDIYGERTSGVFLEAVSAAKIVICTRDTWMSDLLDVHGGGIAIRDRSAADLCSAIGRIVTDRAKFQDRAISAAALWNTIHTPENLVAHLLGKPTVPASLPRKRRALVIYPWGDAVDGNSGAAVRMRLLVSQLEQSYGEVRLAFTAVGESGGQVGSRTPAEPYYHMRIRARALRKVIDLATAVMGGKNTQGFHLWFHVWPLFDGLFRAQCDALVQWADDVYLDYGYFVPVVAPLCDRHGKRLVVTQLDLVSRQARGVPVIHGITRWLELRALRRAPRLVLCTEDEREELARDGIVSELIPHPVDLRFSHYLTAEEARLILSSLYGVAGDRPICFFVGSAYEPNRHAAEFIHRMAEGLRDDPGTRNILFVVAGACMPPMQEINFIALGRVEEAALTACYERASIVLVPITEGTGSSIKSIEAMARGALVLSTSVGMRGIPIEAGRHCIIEDDLSRFAERIQQILGDPEMGESVRAEARAFGAAYDFRRLLARYGWSETDADTFASEDPGEALRQHRQGAIRDLLPRLRQVRDADTRHEFTTLFGLTGAEAPQPEPLPVEATAIPSPEVTAVPHSEPPHDDARSVLRRVGKRVLLLLPPVRNLYDQVLLANARSAAQESEIQRLEDLLRQAAMNSAPLDADPYPPPDHADDVVQDDEPEHPQAPFPMLVFGAQPAHPDEDARHGGLGGGCPICGCTRSEFMCQVAGRSLLICRDCRHITWEAMPTDDELTEFYSHAYSSSHHQLELQESHKLYYRGHVTELAELAGVPVTKLRMADVGCSFPVLLAEAVALGCPHPLGVDWSEEAKAYGARHGIPVVTPEVFLRDVPDATLDVLRYSHTLEHVPDPVAVLRSHAAKLRPGGLLYITQPNTPLLREGIAPEPFDAIYPTHLHFFSPASVVALAEAADCAVERIFTVGEPEAAAARHREAFDLEYAAALLAPLAPIGEAGRGPLNNYPYFYGRNVALFARRRLVSTKIDRATTHVRPAELERLGS